MPYAVVVPGISNVFNNWNDVANLITLYPHPKYRKFKTTEECWEFVKRYTNKRIYHDLNKYGDTFNNLYVSMEYFIQEDKVYYNFHTKKIGYISIEPRDENVTIANRNGTIKAILHNIYLNDDVISNHLIAIWHGLMIIGDLVDIDVKVPDHSIFYALMTYTGENKTIKRVRTYIDERAAKVSVSMKDFGEETEDDADKYADW